MLKLSYLEFFARAIPEGLLLIFSAHAFSKTAVNIKKYLLTAMIYAILVYFIRFLPIQYGVNTILSIIVIIALMVLINKVDIINAIKACIITVIIEFICEGINVLIIQYVLKADTNYIFKDPTLKTLYGIPSLFLFGCITGIYYLILLKRKELKYS